LANVILKTCETCGNGFQVYPCFSNQRFCSRACINNRSTPDKKFWPRVKRGSIDECWPWQGCSDGSGYGVLTVNKRQIRAHRYAYELTSGPIPESEEYHGTVVRHTCDNRICCNPAHLVLGTQKDNVRDMMERGKPGYRHFRGEEHGQSKIDVDTVRLIRSDPRSALALAKVLNISQSQILRIRNRESWVHVE
jgi:hypothetical protein